MFAALTRRLLSAPARRPHRPAPARLSAELLEGRDVPSATFERFSAASPSPQGLAWTSEALAPVDTDNDLSSYERVTFTFTDNSAGSQEVVYLLVYNKFDDSYPPNVDPSQQTLLNFDRVVTTGVAGQVYTLTAYLPKCDYQVDATFAPGGVLSQTPPPGYGTALEYNLQAALGSNDCPDFGPRTQGYWKNRGADLGWPVETLALGNRTYSQADLLAILNTPVRGNGAISLAHQLIAAKLNLASGADPSGAVIAAVSGADLLLADIDLTAAGAARDANWLAPSATSALTSQLDAFNNS